MIDIWGTGSLIDDGKQPGEWGTYRWKIEELYQVWRALVIIEAPWYNEWADAGDAEEDDEEEE